MHIPEAMLQGAVCPVTAAITTLGLSATAYAAWKSVSKPSAAAFGAVTALIFAGQMLNFPIQLGTSGHILGATLAVALLGSSFGILSMALVVSAQCLVFADGGVGVLGANLLNMALLAALPAVVVREYFVKDSLTVPTRAAMYFTAAVLSVVIAAAACSVELAVAGVMPLAKVLPAMLFVHLLIGLCEAALTFAACYLLIPRFSMVASSRSYFYPLGAAAVAALMISPFACSSPDGLEWVAQTLGFVKEAAPMFVTPFADYTVPAVSPAVLSTAFAGMFGVVLMFAAAFGVRKLFR